MISKAVKCPKYSYETTVIGESGKKIILTCPKCNTKGKYLFPEGHQQLKNTSDSIAIEVKGLVKTFNG